MTHLGPDGLYRPGHAGRHANHTQAMLVAAIAVSLTIVCAAAAVISALIY